jgi:hypothetical protein
MKIQPRNMLEYIVKLSITVVTDFKGFLVCVILEQISNNFHVTIMNFKCYELTCCNLYHTTFKSAYGETSSITLKNLLNLIIHL